MPSGSRNRLSGRKAAAGDSLISIVLHAPPAVLARRIDSRQICAQRLAAATSVGSRGEFLAGDDRFVVDRERERYLITYNPSGFLKRVK